MAHFTNARLEAMRVWLFENVGRRALLLVIFSTVFFLIGIQAAFYPAQFPGRANFYLDWPSSVRACLWLITSTLGYVAAFRRKKTAKDALGFAALSIPASFVFFSQLFSWFAFLAGATDYGQAWVDALKWLLILLILLICAGWPEVPATSLIPNGLNTVDQTVVVLDQDVQPIPPMETENGFPQRPRGR